MGLGDTGGAKNLLKTRAPSGWLNRNRLNSESTREDVTFVISDFLLDVHRIGGNPMLTYEGLVSGIQNNVLNFVKAFPNLDAIVILLDEQKYVPLGKVPTQDKRKKPLSNSERAKILDGGVISKMDPNLQESIDAIYSKESSVRDGKNTAFSVFFERYVRTRELRQDLVVFIARCLMKLVETGAISDGIRVYIDGMTVSTYYSSPDHLFSATTDDDGTPLVKRRRSLSAVETVNLHKHEDDEHLSVCKLVWTTDEEHSISLTSDHPSSSLCDTGRSGSSGLGMTVKPLWLRKSDGDSEIFMGYKGPYDRTNMGESDIKIAYYVRRVAETLAYQTRCMDDPEGESPVGCTCLVSSADTDIIVILLLCVKEIPSSVSQCFDILLDTNVGGSTKEIISIYESVSHPEGSSADGKPSDSSSQKSPTNGKSGVYSHALGRVVWKEEGEYLTNVANIQALARGIDNYFRELHPGVTNAVDTLCLFLLLTGSDYVDSLPGIGFEKLRTIFDLGGYWFLSQAISIQEARDHLPETSRMGRNGRTIASAKKLQLNLDEGHVKAFLNLVYRYAFKIGPLKTIASELTREKSRLTKEIKDRDKAIHEIKFDEDGERNSMTQEDCDDIERIEEEKEDIKRQRDFIDNFLPQKYYTSLTNAFDPSLAESTRTQRLIYHIRDTFGITAVGKEHEDWATIEKAIKAKRLERITRSRNSLITKVNKDKKLSDEKKREKLEEIRSISDRDILSSLKRDLSDLESIRHVESVIRRVGWNLAYWIFSPYVCPRETKHLNSMCRLNTAKREISNLLSRAQEQSSKGEDRGDNHRMEDYYAAKPYPESVKRARKEVFAKESPRDQRMSLNGFLRVYENGEESTRKKPKIIRSAQIFPASRVIIDLLDTASLPQSL